MDMARLSLRILGYLHTKRVASYRELARQLHESTKDVAGTVYYLTKTQRLKRLPFSTMHGRVYYMPDTPTGEAMEYCYQHGLVPRCTQLFFQKMKEQKCVSTMELYSMGMDLTDVRFFIDHFTKQWKLIKLVNMCGHVIFYTNEEDLKTYMDAHREHLEKLRRMEWDRRTEEGRLLEENIEKFYQANGFATKRNQWFVTPDSEKLEVDVLAEKHFFNYPNDRAIIIAVQCKAWDVGHTYNLTDFLSYYCKLKSIFPGAQFHIWAYHYSKHFFTNSFAKRFPDVTIYYSKHIREALKEALPQSH